MGSGVFGYRIVSAASATVNWNVESRLSRVDSAGFAEKVVAETKQFVGEVSKQKLFDFVLETPKEPGIYRYDIAFSNQEGNLLAQYSSYVRVVRSKLAVSLGIQKRMVAPGGNLAVRIENRGTAEIKYGVEYSLQKRVGHRWQFADSGPKGRAPSIGLIVAAGEASACQTIPLSPDLTAGRYRVLKKMSRNLPRAGRRQELVRAVEFRVR